MTAMTCVLDCRARLGESVIWSVDQQRLYWVDIDGHTINRFDPASGTNEVCPVGEQVGCIALRAKPDARGDLVAALRSGFAFVDFAGGTRTPIADPEADRPDNRFNDGRAGPDGAFWAGTMRDPPDLERRTGALYRLAPDLGVTRVVDDVGVSNGLAWSPDAAIMYHADSWRPLQTLFAYDFDRVTGAIAGKRVFHDCHDLPGRPDGGCVDAEGFYWSANVDGWQVVRFAPDGSVDRTIPVPAQKPSMTCFGGPDLATLYVTTIGAGGTMPMEPGQPQAGSIFACEPGVTGLPEPPFRG